MLRKNNVKLSLCYWLISREFAASIEIDLRQFYLSTNSVHGTVFNKGSMACRKYDFGSVEEEYALLYSRAYSPSDSILGRIFTQPFRVLSSEDNLKYRLYERSGVDQVHCSNFKQHAPSSYMLDAQGDARIPQGHVTCDIRISTYALCHSCCASS